MKLIFKPKEFEHLENKSRYNNNFYKYTGQKNRESQILEICHEDENFYEFYMVDFEHDDELVFLGCSQDSITSEKESIEIDFRYFYT